MLDGVVKLIRYERYIRLPFGPFDNLHDLPNSENNGFLYLAMWVGAFSYAA